MLEVFGLWTRDYILSVAELLTDPSVPGIVSLSIIVAAAIICFLIWIVTARELGAVIALSTLVQKAANETEFTQQYSTISKQISGWRTNNKRRLSDAWAEFRETLIEPIDGGNAVIRNSARPNEFFNVSNLGFGLAGWRFWPGVFVSVGLFLTFLGLVAALIQTGETLRSAGSGADQTLLTAALNDLLSVASAKFIMSLSGLFASIILSLFIRWRSRKIENAVADLSHQVERRVQFVSLEALSQDQLEEARSMRSHMQRLNTELIEALTKPLQQAVDQGSDAAGQALRAVAGQVADTLSGSITHAGEQMELASEKMADLTSRLADVTNGFVSEMEKTTAGLDAVSRRLEMVNGKLAAAGEKLERGATPLAESIAETSDTARSIAKASINMVNAAQVSLSEQSTVLLSTATAIREQVDAFEQRAKAYDGEMDRALRSYKDNLDSAVGEVEKFSSSVHDRYADALQRLQSLIDGAKSYEPETTGASERQVQ